MRTNRLHYVQSKVSNKKLKEKGTIVCPECFSILNAQESKLRTGFHWCHKCNAEFVHDGVWLNSSKED